jgi:crotonobetainyl-CoA:carnitine CoA-transferase CaiB-like acyl-CoA transferase
MSDARARWEATVIVASRHPSALFAGRVLAGLGLSAVLIADEAALPEHNAWAETRARFLTDYASRVLSLGDDDDRRELDGIIAGAAPTVWILAPSVPARLEAIIPAGARRVTVSDFSVGPRSSWAGSEAVFQALSGIGYLTGTPDEPPLLGIGERSRYSAGVAVAVNALSLLLADREHVMEARLGVAETVAQIHGSFTAARYAFNGTHQDRRKSGGLVSMLQCEGKWLVLYAARPADWKACCAVFGLSEYADDPRFAGLGPRFENWDVATALLRDAATRLTPELIFERAREIKLPISLVHSAETLWADPHLRERSVWSQDALSPDLTLAAPYIFDDEYERRVHHEHQPN